jgi:hypothetical protein
LLGKRLIEETKKLPPDELQAFKMFTSDLILEPEVVNLRNDKPYALIVDSVTANGQKEGGRGILYQADDNGNLMSFIAPLEPFPVTIRMAHGLQTIRN